MSVGSWNTNSWSIKENENSTFRESVLQNDLPSLAKYCTVMTDVNNAKSVAMTVDKMFKRRQTYV
jgi:ribosomal protein L17